MSISILGGGISGLSALHFIKKSEQGKDIRVHLYEKSSIPGGWVASDKNDYHFELGPRSIRSSSLKHTLDIIEDLDLIDELIYPSTNAKGKFICRNGELKQVPSSILGLIRERVIYRNIFSILIGIFSNQRNNIKEDESIRDFYSRIFGGEVTDYFIEPVYVGINASHISQLSMRTTQTNIFERSKKYGRFILTLLSLYFTKNEENSLKQKILSKGGMFSFKDGMDTLPLRLKEKYESSITFNFNVDGIGLTPDKKHVDVFCQDKIISSDIVILALPAYEISKIFAPYHSELSKLFNEIEYISIACVSVGYNGDVIPEEYKGFGFLVSPKDKNPVLGVTFDSVIFPDDKKQTRLTFMIGGHKNIHENIIDVTQTSKTEIESIALRSLKKHLKIEKEPDYMNVHICKQAIPQHFVGHEKRMQRINEIMEKEFPNVKICGAFVKDVSINGCIDNAYETVEDILNSKLLNNLQ